MTRQRGTGPRSVDATVADLQLELRIGEGAAYRSDMCTHLLPELEPDKLVNYFARRVPDLIELPNGNALGQQIEIELKFWSSS